MLPLRDANPTRITPYVTLGLIAINLIVFFVLQYPGSELDHAEFVYERAAIACEVTTGDPLDVAEIVTGVCGATGEGEVFPGKNVYLALVVSMFLHGGIGHVLFNMWFLWIFGNNVEEAYGHVWYAMLYLFGGLAATAGFIALNVDTTVPLVGASGAIAAVMGSYLVLFPQHRVTSLLGWIIVPLPAAIFLAIWFASQFLLFNAESGVAWEAHAGGFVFGVAVTLLFRDRLLRRVAAA
jgi:rhomboid family protein